MTWSTFGSCTRTALWGHHKPCLFACLLAACPAYTQAGYIVTSTCAGTAAGATCTPAASCDSGAGYLGIVVPSAATCSPTGTWTTSTVLSGCSAPCKRYSHSLPTCHGYSHSLHTCHGYSHILPTCRGYSHSLPTCHGYSHSLPTCYDGSLSTAALCYDYCPTVMARGGMLFPLCS